MADDYEKQRRKDIEERYQMALDRLKEVYDRNMALIDERSSNKHLHIEAKNLMENLNPEELARFIIQYKEEMEDAMGITGKLVRENVIEYHDRQLLPYAAKITVVFFRRLHIRKVIL